MANYLSSPVLLARRILHREPSTSTRSTAPTTTTPKPANSKNNSKKDVDYLLIVSTGPKRWFPTRNGHAEYPTCIFSPDGLIYKDSPRIATPNDYVTISKWGCEFCVAQTIKDASTSEVSEGHMAVLLEITTVKIKKLNIYSVGIRNEEGEETLPCIGGRVDNRECLFCSNKKVRRIQKKLRWKTVAIPEYMAGNPEDLDYD